jgi:hypothetical protein
MILTIMCHTWNHLSCRYPAYFFKREERHVKGAGSIHTLRLNIGLTRVYPVLSGKAVVNLALETTFV